MEKEIPIENLQRENIQQPSSSNQSVTTQGNTLSSLTNEKNSEQNNKNGNFLPFPQDPLILSDSPSNAQMCNQQNELPTTTQPDGAAKNHQYLAERAKCLEKAATILEDPENEGDDYYATVRSIYTYFNHSHSILTILNAIHQAAGDVALAVKRLSHIKVGNESGQFLFKSIVAPQETIEQYFSY